MRISCELLSSHRISIDWVRHVDCARVQVTSQIQWSKPNGYKRSLAKHAFRSVYIFTLFTFYDKHQHRVNGKRASEREKTSECTEEEKTISAKILLTRFRRTNNWMNTQWTLWKHFAEVKHCNRMRPPTIWIRKCHSKNTIRVRTQCNEQILFQHFHANDDGNGRPTGHTVSFRLFCVCIKKLCFHRKWQEREKKWNS